MKSEPANAKLVTFGTERESDEMVIPVCSSRITGVQALSDNSGFVVSTEDGLLFTYYLKNVTAFKLIQAKTAHNHGSDQKKQF